MGVSEFWDRANNKSDIESLALDFKLDLPQNDVQTYGNPEWVVKQLDKTIIGQHAAKTDLAIAFCELYMRKPDEQYTPSDTILRGDTGCGKTSLIRKITTLFKIPYEEIQGGVLVQSGIVGNRIEHHFAKLYQKLREAAGDPENTTPQKKIYNSSCVMVIDEFDKICNGKNHYGHQVQQELVSYMDYGVHKGVDTRNILFIAAGAFEGLGEGHKQVGFTRKTDTERNVMTDEALKQYGMINELYGRFTRRTHLHRLTKQHLIEILDKSDESPLTILQNFYRNSYNTELMYTECAIEKTAQIASMHTTGARALDSVIEKTLREFKFKVAKYAGTGYIVTGDEVAKTNS